MTESHTILTQNDPTSPPTRNPASMNNPSLTQDNPLTPSPTLPNHLPNSIIATPHTPLSNQELQSMALQLQNNANWLGQILQQRGLNILSQ